MKATWVAPCTLAVLSVVCWVGWGASFSASMDWADGPAGVARPWHYVWTWPMAAMGLVLAIGALTAVALRTYTQATRWVLGASLTLSIAGAAAMTTFAG